jgi:hypothetical protein
MKFTLPKYPVYIISKGRAKNLLTARFLIKDEVPFQIAIEPQEESEYAPIVGKDRLLILPFSNLGQGSIPARNWVWEHAKSEGHSRHWILDDNIRSIKRRYFGYRIKCKSGNAFAAVESLIDRYENVAIA